MSAAAGIRVAVVASHTTAVADGIRDYSERLVATLAERPDIHADLVYRPYGAFATSFTSGGQRGFGDRTSPDAVIVQYNPFWYGRRGFAPGLPLALRALKRKVPNASIALMVHETYVDPKNWKWALMSAWQRAQLRALQQVVDVQLCSIEVWTERLRRWAPDVPTRHLPVPSNLPDRRAARLVTRAELGIDEDAIVLATFGLTHPGRLTKPMLAAARAVRRSGRPVFVLNLGTGEPTRAVISGDVNLIAPGFLHENEAAEALAAADVFLAAFADGVSTRRGTLMAALQHELAVVGTHGHLTDTVLRQARHALRLTPVGRESEFVQAVVDVAADDALRRKLAAAGRRFYEENFDWPVLVESLLRTLEESRP